MIIAFYVQSPPGIVTDTVTVPVNVVVEILKNNKAKVEESLEGRTVVYIRPYKQTPEGPEPIKTWVWIVVGVCCGVFVLLVIILLCCILR